MTWWKWVEEAQDWIAVKYLPATFTYGYYVQSETKPDLKSPVVVFGGL